MEERKKETRTIIIYEAPHRLVRTMGELYETLGNRRIAICRELTKRYEMIFRTTFEEVLEFYEEEEPIEECRNVTRFKSSVVTVQAV